MTERRFGWSDMFVNPDEDPRTDGGFKGERATLVGFLRLTLELKCAGLDAPPLYGGGDAEWDGAVPDPEVVAEACRPLLSGRALQRLSRMSVPWIESSTAPRAAVGRGGAVHGRTLLRIVSGGTGRCPPGPRAAGGHRSFPAVVSRRWWPGGRRRARPRSDGARPT
jgi:hypothetical protein